MNRTRANRAEEKTPFMHIVVRRTEVEQCNIDLTLQALSVLVEDRETALRFKGSVGLSLQGYDDDPRGVFEIQDVREFVAKLNARWYSWFFFMTKDMLISPISVIALCLCQYTRSSFGLFIPVVQDLREFLWFHFGALRGICQVYNLSQEETEVAVYEILDYLMKVGFVEGCDSPQLPVDLAKTGTVLRWILM
jgi:hypothetical protein